MQAKSLSLQVSALVSGGVEPIQWSYHTSMYQAILS